MLSRSIFRQQRDLTCGTCDLASYAITTRSPAHHKAPEEQAWLTAFSHLEAELPLPFPSISTHLSSLPKTHEERVVMIPLTSSPSTSPPSDHRREQADVIFRQRHAIPQLVSSGTMDAPCKRKRLLGLRWSVWHHPRSANCHPAAVKANQNPNRPRSLDSPTK